MHQTTGEKLCPQFNRTACRCLLTQLSPWPNTLKGCHSHVNHFADAGRKLDHYADGGKLAEGSDKNEHGWLLCPKIHPNFSWMKVRTDFRGLTFCRRAGYFSRESCNTGFRLL